jgi:branched-chain amino acid aminotransferase
MRRQICSRCFLLLIVAVRAHVTTAAAAAASTLPGANKHADPVDNVDWDSFNFGLNGVETDNMWMDRSPVDASGSASYSTDSLQPLGTLNLSPAATVLNYGQALFEGLKAFRRADGTIAMFRPEKNAARMQQVGIGWMRVGLPEQVCLVVLPV